MTDCWVELPEGLFSKKQVNHFKENFGVRYNRSDKIWEVPEEAEELLFDCIDAYESRVSILTLGPIKERYYYDRYLAEKVGHNRYRVPAIYSDDFKRDIRIPRYDLKKTVFMASGVCTDGAYDVAVVDFNGELLISGTTKPEGIERLLQDYGKGKVFVYYAAATYLFNFPQLEKYPSDCSMMMFARFFQGLTRSAPRPHAQPRLFADASRYVHQELTENVENRARCNRAIFKYLTLPQERERINKARSERIARQYPN